MYALTYLYGGCSNTMPFAQTIAVSESRQTLVEEMQRCIEEDIDVNEDDIWSDSCNFEVFKEYVDKVTLIHRHIEDLYAYYEIRNTSVL